MLFGSHEEIHHDNNHAPALQEFYEAHEGFDDPAIRRDYFGRMSEQDFVDFTQTITSIIRTGDSSQRQEYDGEEVKLMGHEVPDQRDKTDLIRQTWRVARGFLNDPEFEDRQALEYAGLTAAGGILYAHVNIDGNGRLARAVDYALEEGTEQPLDGTLEKILGENGGSEWYVAPDDEAVRHYMDPHYPKEINGYVIPQKTVWQEFGDVMDDDYLSADDPVDIVSNSDFGNISLVKFLEHADGRALDTFEKHTNNIEENGMVKRVLNARAALQELTSLEDDGIRYAAQILEADRATRKEFVENFLHIMESRDLRNLPPQLLERLEIQKNFPNPVPRATQLHFGRLAVEGQITLADHASAHHRIYSRILRTREGLERPKKLPKNYNSNQMPRPLQ